MTTSVEIVTRAGITYRQLDHWTRLGYLTLEEPHPGSGNARTYPETEIHTARRIRVLLDSGLTLTAAVQAVRDGHVILGANRVTIAVEALT